MEEYKYDVFWDRLMKYEGILIFLAIAMIILDIGLLLNLGIIEQNKVFGENYSYNLTKQESDELIISELCYAGIDIGECNLIYGGIDTPYGDKMK